VNAGTADFQGEPARDDGALDKGRPAGPSVSTFGHLTDGLRAAIKNGHTDAVRYLTTRVILSESLTRVFKTDRSIMTWIMCNGRLDMVRYAHDRSVCRRGLCHCNATVSKAVWGSDNPDVPRWLREHECKAYRAPLIFDIVSMLEQGRLAMLRHAAPDYAPQPNDRAMIDAALTGVARRGDRTTIETAIDVGLCASLAPALMGAVAGGHRPLVEWLVSGERDPRTAGLPRLTDSDMRSAVLYALGDEKIGIVPMLAWIAERFGTDALDPPMIYVAFRSHRLESVRALDALVVTPRGASVDWASLMPSALMRKSAAYVRFLVEERAVTVTPDHIVHTLHMSAEVVEYVVSRFTTAVFQDAVDRLCWRVLGGMVSRIVDLQSHVPDLCVARVAEAAAAGALYGNPWEARVGPCDCARCRDRMRRNLDPLFSSDSESRARPSKRDLCERDKAAHDRDDDDDGNDIADGRSRGTKRRRHDADDPGSGADDPLLFLSGRD
jgi:hypothetical protein